jgi:hypothetical protein
MMLVGWWVVIWQERLKLAMWRLPENNAEVACVQVFLPTDNHVRRYLLGNGNAS